MTPRAASPVPSSSITSLIETNRMPNFVEATLGKLFGKDAAVMVRAGRRG
jgi:hypothetical protein